jgi:hypothetical protein
MNRLTIGLVLVLMVVGGCQTGMGPDNSNDGNGSTDGNNGGSTPDGGKTDGSGPHIEKGGQVVVEAENFSSSTADSIGGRTWVPQLGMQSGPGPDPDGFHEGSSGAGYLELLPDTRVTERESLGGGAFYDESTDGASLSYEIEFETPGIYYVWGRAYSTGTEDNGLHVGVDNQIFESGFKMQWCGAGRWSWSNAKRDTGGSSCGVNGTITINVPSAGRHIVMVFQREDGMELDRFILTTDPNFTPDGAGPAESPRLNP